MEEFLIRINDMMLENAGAAFAGCFLWGIVSTVLSPCHLASIPLLVSYIAGQKVTMTPRNAGIYSVLFSFGLFAAIFVVGTACAVLGRMLGDIPAWAYAAAGILLLYMGLRRFRSGCNIAYWRILGPAMEGYRGAFLLGLLYGIISSACIFGFLAPMLFLILQEHQIARGILMTVIFGIGHCTPIVIAGCGFGLAETHYLSGEKYIRPISALVIMGVGAYFLGRAFLS